MPIPQRLDYYRRDTHGLALITLVGEIDQDSAPLLREALEGCLRDGMNTVSVLSSWSGGSADICLP